MGFWNENGKKKGYSMYQANEIHQDKNANSDIKSLIWQIGILLTQFIHK